MFESWDERFGIPGEQDGVGSERASTQASGPGPRCPAGGAGPGPSRSAGPGAAPPALGDAADTRAGAAEKRWDSGEKIRGPRRGAQEAVKRRAVGRLLKRPAGYVKPD